MQYKLSLNLQQIATLRVATLFWEKKEVQIRIAEFLESWDNLEISEARTKWYKLIKEQVENWNEDLLPKPLHADFPRLITSIGERIFSWYNYIKYEYGIINKEFNYIDKIHWTTYGTVDAVKIFKSSWLNNPNLDIYEMYKFACEHVLEDHLNDLWHKMPRNIQNSCNTNLYQFFDMHILAYWKHCREDDLLSLTEYFQMFSNSHPIMQNFSTLYDMAHSPEENMMRLVVYEGYFIATKYFWEKLTTEEKDKSVLTCARIAVMVYAYYGHGEVGLHDYKRSQWVEICIFLMNQMTESQKREFFNEELGLNNALESCTYTMENLDVKDEVLKMFLFTWPWEELFIPVLEEMIQYQDDDSKMACVFLNSITFKMYEDDNLGYSLEANKYRNVFHQAWTILPPFIKQKILQEDSIDSFINNLVYMWDINSLELIFDDPGIAKFRNDFIDLGCQSYLDLILNDQFKVLDQLIAFFLQTEREIENFKWRISNFSNHLILTRFHLVDKYFDWLCSNPEQKETMKNNIDHIYICDCFIQMQQYVLLNEFLNWRFDTEAEKRLAKDHFKNNIFTTRQICGLWKFADRDIEKAQIDSSQFLNWLLESEEEVALFKKQMLIGFERDPLITHYLLALQSFNTIDNFLSWCVLSDEVTQYVKEVLSLN